jgi:hypothetical protein
MLTRWPRPRLAPLPLPVDNGDDKESGTIPPRTEPPPTPAACGGVVDPVLPGAPLPDCCCSCSCGETREDETEELKIPRTGDPPVCELPSGDGT